jgi:UrcA family protein
MSASIAMTAAGLVVAAAPAFAKTPTVAATGADNPTLAIRYADLDLTSIDGENALRARAKSAVRSMCAGMGDGSRSTFAEAYCRSDSWKGVDPQIRRAVQQARDLAATGRSQTPAVAIVISK